MKRKEEAIWKKLNSYGIRTKEEFYEAYKKQEPINITCMVSPVRTDSKEVGV